MLAGFFANVLGTPRVGVHDDFFALGGDSSSLPAPIAPPRATHVTLSFESVFAMLTVAGLARRIAASGEGAPVCGNPAEFARHLGRVRCRSRIPSTGCGSWNSWR